MRKLLHVFGFLNFSERKTSSSSEEKKAASSSNESDGKKKGYLLHYFLYFFFYFLLFLNKKTHGSGSNICIFEISKSALAALRSKYVYICNNLNIII